MIARVIAPCMGIGVLIGAIGSALGIPFGVQLFMTAGLCIAYLWARESKP